MGVVDGVVLKGTQEQLKHFDSRRETTTLQITTNTINFLPTMVKSVYGGAPISAERAFNTPEIQAELLDILLEHGITTIDTARIYIGSEKAIGSLAKRNKFTIDTKLGTGFRPDNASKEAIVRDTQDSLKTVDIPQFDILYFHAPEVNVPWEEQLEGINEAYKKGIFRRFGLSNFTPEQVQEVYDIAKSKGFVLPTAFQGNYNPVARHYETILFPTLRKLGISFYAYSPLAGGFLTKTAADIDAGVGRFNANVLNGLYKALYDMPTLREALLAWNKIAEKEGVPNAELAYRWMVHHSALKGDEDAVIFGSRTLEQTMQTAQSLKKGRLSDEAVKAIDAIWERVKDEAPRDNFEVFQKIGAKR